ncbi:MAG TPA: HDOD domain-containing protein [Rhodocyclaceae bacterium]|nr:HDOD domain-containing protein [Rhodocyclaceae bacterium]
MTENSQAPKQEDVAQVLVNIVIPPCPKIVLAMVAEGRAEDPDLNKLDKLLSGDVGLASAVIKTANSPYYGLNRKVEAVKQAIIILGIRSVTNIVTMLALQKALAVSAGTLDRFWDRSHYHAIACARLARHLRFISADGAYTFGLFNDCGIPILIQRFADYKETLQLANTADRPFVEVENERHSTNHALVGSFLAHSWHLPEIICNAIRDHHVLEPLYGESAKAGGDIAALAAISLIADFLVNDFLNARQESEWVLHGAQAMQFLGFDEEELAEIKVDINDDLEAARAYRL